MRLRLEELESRFLPSTFFGLNRSFPMTEGTNGSALVATFVDSDTVTSSNFNASINWGDGTATTVGTISQLGPHSFAVVGTHAYAEESSFGFTLPVQVSINDIMDNRNIQVMSSAQVADAVLSPNKVSAAPTAFSGVGSAGAKNALASFEAAIGGANNKDNPPQPGGFRAINWDGVKLDGTDFNGNTTVISQGTTVGIPINRFQSRGIEFEEVYAVSGDGFATVAPQTKGLFPAFSPNNTFTMFNENTIDFRFVLASDPTTSPRPAVSRGFGAIFINVRLPNTTSIEYFNGDSSLGKFFVPAGAAASPEFFGVLFNNPVVTRATITLGTDALFNFDGTTFSSSAVDNPGAGHNVAVTDDFAYAEPQPLPPPPPPRLILPKQGVPFTGVVAAFFDTDPKGNAKDFTATIDWGDGHQSPGTIAASSGGFTVTGTNTYAHTGLFHINVAIADFGGSVLVLPANANVGLLSPGATAAGQASAASVAASRDQASVPRSVSDGALHDAALMSWSNDFASQAQSTGKVHLALPALNRHLRLTLDIVEFAAPQTDGADIGRTC
jgi:hypothetical protein